MYYQAAYIDVPNVKSLPKRHRFQEEIGVGGLGRVGISEVEGHGDVCVSTGQRGELLGYWDGHFDSPACW